MKIGEPVVHYLAIESTQTEAKKDLKGVHWTTNQTGGKGRFDRQWHSEAGQSLAMSIAFPDHKGSEKPFLLSMWICLAVAQEFDLRIQWPNDLVLNKKKVCGVLTEIVDGVPVVGIGINVGKMSFPNELAGRASSFANENHLDLTPHEAFDRVMAALMELDPVPSDWSGVEAKWKEFDETEGKVFSLHDGRIGIAIGVSNEGELIWNGRGEYELVTCADALWGAAPTEV